jgi:hypothetical protein
MNKKSSFFRVDEQVFLTMGALCVLAIVIMAFRAGNRTPCSAVRIAVKSPELTERTLLRFSAETAGGKNFVWNFGDGTPEKEEVSANINHEYKKPGKYTVTVLVNGDCSDIQNVLITEQPPPAELSLKPMIMTGGLRSDTAYVGEAVQFFDNSIGAREWEWRFGETSGVDNSAKDPVYTFRYPGKKVIALKVNNNVALQDRYSLVVVERQVNPVRTGDKPGRPVRPVLPVNPGVGPLPQPQDDGSKETEKVKPKMPAITDAQLSQLLMQVAKGNKTAQDFSPYLDGQLNVSVSLNKDVMPFSKMCEELKNRGAKKIKNISVFSTVDGETNRILSMNVTVEKKGLLDRIF